MTTTQTNLEVLGAMLHVMLITCTWGNANIKRYARSTQDVHLDDGTIFTAAPSLKITFDKSFQGGVEDSEVTLEISTRHQPFDDLASAYVHAGVDVVIEEMIPGDDATRQEVFSGRISKVTARPSATDGLARCVLSGIRRKLDAPLGLQAITTCNWQFGDHNGSPCGYALDANSVAGTITALNVDGQANRVTFTPTGAPPVWDAQKWNRGYINIDGLHLTIRASLGAGKFDLRKFPPPYVVGAAAVLVPGCDKQIPTCRYHKRESQFCGLGYALPKYNPILSEGA